MLAWKTHSYRHLLAQFNAMERFSVPEFGTCGFGNVKRKSVSESIPVASTLQKHTIQSSVLNIESNAAGSHHAGN